MKVLRGKAIDEVDRAQIAAVAREYDQCLIDLGTGDGRFLYRYARTHHDTLCIGLDPVAAAMRKSSHRCQRKPAKGGLANALFVVASVESLPHELAALADIVTINYPWGSLLRALILPEPEILAGIRRLARHRAKLVLLLNHSVFDDPDYLDRLGLPPLSAHRVVTVLREHYAAVGFTLSDPELIEGASPHQTSWGQRLHLGSHRRSMLIEASITGS